MVLLNTLRYGSSTCFCWLEIKFSLSMNSNAFDKMLTDFSEFIHISITLCFYTNDLKYLLCNFFFFQVSTNSFLATSKAMRRNRFECYLDKFKFTTQVLLFILNLLIYCNFFITKAARGCVL